MREGSIVAFASPEQLLRAAKGNVWEMVVAAHEFEDLRKTARVSAAVRKSDGVHVRVVGTPPPGSGAEAAEPTLEDAFLLTMSERALA